MKQRPKAVDISTAPYPGFPTDLQSQWLAMSTIADGITKIEENIFESRLNHAYQLEKMGAKTTIENNTCYVTRR